MWSWSEIEDDDGRIYYWNRETGSTSWSNPVKEQVVRVMEVIDEVQCVIKNTRLQTAVNITIDYKMRRALKHWFYMSRNEVVPKLINALDSWKRLELRSNVHIKSLLNELKFMDSQNNHHHVQHVALLHALSDANEYASRLERSISKLGIAKSILV